MLSTINDAERFGINIQGEISADYSFGVARSRQVVDRLTRGVDSLLKKNKIDLFIGNASFIDTNQIGVGDEKIDARNIVVATGARPRLLPSVEVDGTVVVTYREAIVQTTCPKNVVIIGGGVIGVEFAYIYRAYGANVTIVEMEGNVLPREDEEISKLLTRSLESQGIKLYTGTKVLNVQRDSDDSATVELQSNRGTEQVHADRVLVAIGIQANVEELNLDKAAIEVEKGFIKVDQNLQTTGKDIYAIGDVTGIKPLAHVAQAQGTFVAEYIAGEQSYQLDYSNMPSAVYCVPQVASMGITEQEARTQGLNHKIGRFPFLANGKALALGETDGLVKVIVDEDSGELLGAHLIGHEVTELLGELSLTRLMEGTHIEVGAVVNAHPSISEAIKEAALAATGKAIHI